MEKFYISKEHKYVRIDSRFIFKWRHALERRGSKTSWRRYLRHVVKRLCKLSNCKWLHLWTNPYESDNHTVPAIFGVPEIIYIIYRFNVMSCDISFYLFGVRFPKCLLGSIINSLFLSLYFTHTHSHTQTHTSKYSHSHTHKNTPLVKHLI